MSAAVATPVCSTAAVARWTPQQKCFRALLVALRGAYYHDRARLFWARHRVRVEFYKYSGETEEAAVLQLIGVTNEVAAFVAEHMRVSVERIARHNEAMLALPPREAKAFRQEYLRREKEHESWCKQKIRAILQRRPPPPYPFC